MHNTLQNTLQKSDIEIFCKIHNLDDIKKEIYLNVFFGEKNMDNLKKCWELCEIINASFNDETGDKLTANSIPQHYTKNKELNKLNGLYDDFYYEPIYFIEHFSLGFSGGNILKYLFRCEDKGKKFDVDKVMFYCDFYLMKTYDNYKNYINK